MNFMINTGRGNIFFDTNILAYSVDKTDEAKHKTAVDLVESVFDGQLMGHVSNQVLAESYRVLTRKVKIPLAESDAKTFILGIVESNNWAKLNYSSQTLKLAMELSSQGAVSIWDSIISATMLENSLSSIYTENTNDFGKIAGIMAINPFKME